MRTGKVYLVGAGPGRSGSDHGPRITVAAQRSGDRLRSVGEPRAS